MQRQRLNLFCENAASSSLWCLVCELHLICVRAGPPLPSCAHSDATLVVSPQTGWRVHSPVSQQVAMADARQPDEHWSSNGQENGENGYSAYGSAYRENGYHGGAAAHPGAPGTNTACMSQSYERPCGKYTFDDVAGSPAVGGSDSWSDRDIQYTQRALEWVQLVHASVGTNRSGP